MSERALMDEEVRYRIAEEDKLIGSKPVFTEKLSMPTGFIDNLFDGDEESSWECWNLLRRSRVNIISIVVDRKGAVLIEQAVSSKDVHRVDGQCRDLLYGSKQATRSAWSLVNRDCVSIKVDVKLSYVTTVESATV